MKNPETRISEEAQDQPRWQVHFDILAEHNGWLQKESPYARSRNSLLGWQLQPVKETLEYLYSEGVFDESCPVSQLPLFDKHGLTSLALWHQFPELGYALTGNDAVYNTMISDLLAPGPTPAGSSIVSAQTFSRQYSHCLEFLKQCRVGQREVTPQQLAIIQTLSMIPKQQARLIATTWQTAMPILVARISDADSAQLIQQLSDPKLSSESVYGLNFLSVLIEDKKLVSSQEEIAFDYMPLFNDLEDLDDDIDIFGPELEFKIDQVFLTDLILLYLSPEHTPESKQTVRSYLEHLILSYRYYRLSLLREISLESKLLNEIVWAEIDHLLWKRFGPTKSLPELVSRFHSYRELDLSHPYYHVWAESLLYYLENNKPGSQPDPLLLGQKLPALIYPKSEHQRTGIKEMMELVGEATQFFFNALAVHLKARASDEDAFTIDMMGPDDFIQNYNAELINCLTVYFNNLAELVRQFEFPELSIVLGEDAYRECLPSLHGIGTITEEEQPYD